jgi:2-hydroxychromene-2-carboxylate isomerase
MRSLDFYFDYLSPYAYLAACHVEALAARHGAALSFRPVLFPALLDHWGQRGPAEIAPKAVHVFRDCLRQARLRGIPFRSPRFHPFRSLSALRLTLAVPDAERARAVRALFAHGWGRGGDLANDEELGQALTAAGLDGAALLEAARGAAVKQALRTETDAAIARGVFGIPTLAFEGELFWGFDQFPHVELALSGRDPLAGVDLLELAPRGVGATRPASRG